MSARRPRPGRRTWRARAGWAVPLTTALLLAGAVPAAAAAPPVTVCGDGIKPAPFTVVPGDLRIEGTGCWGLSRLTVLGDLHVAPGAQANLELSRVAGDVHVGRGAWAELSVDVAGGVHLDGADRVQVTGDIGRSIRGTAGRFGLWWSHVAGAVNVATSDRGGPGQPQFEVVRSEVGGWVSTQGGRTVVHDSWLHRGLTVRWGRSVLLSQTHVSADTTVLGTGGSVHLGDLRHQVLDPGVPTHDPRRSTVVGDVQLERNRGAVVIGTTDVAGALVCTANDRTPRVLADTVAGSRAGQCA
ncbi:hypothetical protein AB6N23_11725 [Cellulomonas sp. 179-A 9B4 NHS]|uniref:hypothetical protein n=1 Tax=Cellulomonas sp. 179-A 9B4 NHS TaxID=3142379 RepID=UPI00399EF1E6